MSPQPSLNNQSQLSLTSTAVSSKDIVLPTTLPPGLSKEMENNHDDEVESLRDRPTTFWLILFAICMALFLSAFELTGVSTALPTIVEDIPNFQASDFIWVGSSYALAGTAFLPLSGSLAQIFGRRPMLQASLILFGIGSAVCGAAKTSTGLIAGRTVQGMGGGGIVMLTNLIIADLVSLQERGKYNAFLSIAWSVAAVLGPPICGALSESGLWRWVFYLNIPLSALVICLISCFLRLKTPPEKFMVKIKRIDYGGNILIIGSTTACVIALTWGGVLYDWSSYRVLVPLIIGVLGLGVFLVYEHYVPTEPTTPLYLFANRTSLSGYFQTFLIHFLLLCFIYYIPVYFQAVKLQNPRVAGSSMLGLAISLAPNSVIVGITLAVFRCYRPQIWMGWTVTIIAFACISVTQNVDNSVWVTIAFMVLLGVGIGSVYTTTMIATLTPLPVEENAKAIATGMFLRMFGQVWGVAIGGMILQNRLKNHLPEEVMAQLPEGMDVAYGSIALIGRLADPVRREVQVIFADSLSTLWYVMTGLSGLGLFVSLWMKHHSMRRTTDKDWGQEEKPQETHVESASA